MSLTAGMKLGPYEIQSALGAGGMGVVYKARDTRLDRTVAIKVLPATLASDPHFRERFDREARAISQLEHPHICTLHDVGEHDGTSYLVMQYLEGETLEARLKKGALPLSQALQCAIQIAEALDRAHRAGIVHRDLKPGNIMLTRTGATLLDFGLAKAAEPMGQAAGLSMLPTTPPNLTAQGTILGTFQYMAPEQLEGREADNRTDIFAFGAVVYEMITGRKAFLGQSHASLISAIMSSAPAPVSTLQALTPAALDRLVATCLAKDPDDRWQSARDLSHELRWVAEHGATEVLKHPGSSARTDRRAWVLAAVSLLVAVGSLVALIYGRRVAYEPLITRLDVVTPPTLDAFSFALSPDGRQLTYVANGDHGSQLFVRAFDQTMGRPLAGTEGASYPFWAPDGHALGFFAGDKLKRVDFASGVSQTLADAPGARGGTWNRDDMIVYALQSAGLLRVAAKGGGSPTAVTHLTEGQGSHRWPQFLPDGRRFLFQVSLGHPRTHGVYLGSLDGGSPRRVLPGETAALFTPPGYLLHVVQGVLVAQRFNADGGVLADESTPIAQSVGTDDGTFHSAFTVSASGVLAHRSGTVSPRQLVWVDRLGKTVGRVWPPDDGVLSGADLSPDGRRIAVTRFQQGNFDIWLIDVNGGTSHRFTFDPANDAQANWSPDGSRIVFASNRRGTWDLFEKSADSAATEHALLDTPQDKFPVDWSSDGRFLLYVTLGTTNGSSLWVLPLSGDRRPVPVVQSSAYEREGQFSPDGQWIAYVSNETGRDEIYVRSFPAQGGKWQVSTAGGTDPRWRRDGRELFYVAPDRKLMAVPIRVARDTHALNPDAPVALFQTRLATGANINVGWYTRPQYAVAVDGRFLMNVSVDDATSSPITIVQNWALALKK
jgi:Tol biopolymer transport system component